MVRARAAMLDLTARQKGVAGEGRTFRLVEQTGCLREFGFGRVVGLWDLPNMVVGHSIAIRRENAIAAGGFPERGFEGWGTEDLAFGARVIASGCYVVPALDWVSFHLEHEGRKESREQEMKGLRRALDAYLELVESEWKPSVFPERGVCLQQYRERVEIYTVEGV